MANTLETVDLVLQMMSSIFAILGFIATVAGINCKDSLAAILLRQLRNSKTRDLQQEHYRATLGREETRVTKRIADMEEGSTERQNSLNRSLSSLSGETIVGPQDSQEQPMCAPSTNKTSNIALSNFDFPTPLRAVVYFRHLKERKHVRSVRTAADRWSGEKHLI